MHCGSAFTFFFVFDFARSPTDAKNLQTHICGRYPWCVALRAPLWSLANQAILVGLGMPARCHARLISASGGLLLSVVLSQQRSLGNNPRLSCCFCRPQTSDKSFSFCSTPYCVIASNTSQFVDVARRLLSAHWKRHEK